MLTCRFNVLGPLMHAIARISIALLLILLLLCSYLELNHELSKKCNVWFNLSICHLNLNSLTSHNFEKINFLEACSKVNKSNIISIELFWLLASFLDSSILTENNNLKINGNEMVRADHPNNVKRRGVYLC